jgi:hypothetical protein
MKFLTGPNQWLVVSYGFHPTRALRVSANPVLPISYQPYPLPAGSQFPRGKTQMGIIRVCKAHSGKPHLGIMIPYIYLHYDRHQWPGSES